MLREINVHRESKTIKFNNFKGFEILHEINFGEFRVSKTIILTSLETSKFHVKSVLVN